MSVKICAQIWVPTGGYTFQIQRTDIAAPVQTITVPAGAYYLSNDAGATDLAAVITALVQASHASLVGFLLSIGPVTGKASMKMVPPGQTATITWGSTALRDLLRYTGAVALITAAWLYGDRMCMYLFVPGRLYSECRWIYAANSVQSTSDTGVVETHYYGDRPRLLVNVQFPGGPYSAVWNDYHALLALWDDALRIGRTCRVYRDTAVLTAYAAQSNPLGYSQGVRVEPKDFEPLPMQAGWYDAWTADFVFQLS